MQLVISRLEEDGGGVAVVLGGGLAVDVVYGAYGCVNAGNKLLIENCNFENNGGFQGSSAYFMGTSKGCQALLNTIVSFSNFTDGFCTDIYDVFPCLGSVFLSLFPLSVKNALLFSGNTQSALSLTVSSIELLPSTQLQFINNSGFNGAALHIVDCSSVIVNDNTSLSFQNNTARYRGGAIYSEACTQATENCFIRHSNSALDPDQWRTNVSFSENQANSLGNSIYINSIQSCVWPKYNKNMTFFWKGWSFLSSDSCPNELRSSRAYVTYYGPAKNTVYPGECIQKFIVFDDWGNDITEQTKLQIIVLSGAAQAISYNEPNCQCYDHAPHFEYRSCEPGEIAIQSDCGNNNYASHSSQILIHPPIQPIYGIVIDLSLKTCDNGTSCVFTSDHPAGICFKSDNSPVSYEAVCNRTRFYETVCGSCVAADVGMSINVPTFNCIDCKNAAGVGYFLIEIVLVMIMMVVLAVLHINITNGNLNAYILYSQMVTLQFPGLGYTAWTPMYDNFIFFSSFKYSSIPLTVYSIWNLNFLTLFPDPFCIPNIRTAVGVISLQYVIAACPLLFIIVSYTWIQCYNNGYRLVVYTTRPVEKALNHVARARRRRRRREAVRRRSS